MRENKESGGFRIEERLLGIGVALAAFLWVVVALVNAFVFDKGSLVQTMFPVRPEELMDRGLLMVALLAFIAYVQRGLKRQRKDEELRLRLAAIVDSSRDAIIGEDPDGTITSWNAGAEALYGYSADEAVGQHISMLAPPGYTDELTDLSEKVRRGERVYNYETVRLTRDGERIDIAMTLSPVYDADGEFVGVSTIARDITELKRSRTEREAYAERLEVSNRELQDFAYVASHDLQEPLRKIQAFGGRLEDKFGDKLEGRGRDYLDRMLDAAARMQRLINDLLTFSRVTTKAQPFVPVDLSEVAEDVVSDLETRIEDTGGSVKVEELSEVEADPTQMRQLLQNLIGNALKFHREDVPPVVKVESRLLGEPGGQKNGLCEVRVADNGIGFDEKYLDRIFTPFERLHGRMEYGGTGIGLAVCRKIVERHGGEITAESKPGEGTTFIFTLLCDQPETIELPGEGRE